MSRINDDCTYCDQCVPACPTGSIFPGYRKYVIDQDTCMECQKCLEVCPSNAIQSGNQDKKVGG